MNTDSEARFKSLWNKQPLEHIANSNKVSLAYDFWCAQEEFWQKKCEELEKTNKLEMSKHMLSLSDRISALEKFVDKFYRWTTTSGCRNSELIREIDEYRAALDACSPKER